MNLATLAAIAILCSASSDVANPADEAWEAYLTGDFARVERLASAFTGDTTLTDTARARIYLTLGCSHAMQGRDGDAGSAFERALALHPFPELTSADIPPPAWRIFEPLRKRFSSQATEPVSPPAAPSLNPPQVAPHALPTPDTIVICKPFTRSGSALRSLAFPGWGHLNEGRRRGWLFAGAEAALAAGWALSTIQAHQAREDYLAARQPDDIEDKYDRYNRFRQLSWGFGIAAVAAYFAAQVDFFLTAPPLELSLKPGRVGLSLTFGM